MDYEIIVIGGGPAGLSAALNFGRGIMHTLVIDEDKPRNKVTSESHGYLTQDGISPIQFKQKAKQDIAKYKDVSFLAERVTDIKQNDEGFEVSTQGQSFKARQVLLATGLRERGPDIHGFNDFYGQSIFYCPWCDGYEMRHRKLAVIYLDKMMTRMVKLLSNFSKDLIVFTNGEIVTSEDKAWLKAKKIDIYTESIANLSGKDGQLTRVTLANGDKVEVGGAFSQMQWDTHFDFLENLSLKRDENEKIEVNVFGETSIKHFYIAGETKDKFAGQIIDAAANGGMVAKMIMMTQINEDF
ncbi:NAD(P)/FAD-dependent oxidoreductase [Staphylococcus sp. NAM3COL9]|uniref:NAD(P)/FAD-dependent oxidoreductase n=1 Tax=Staphylococcus sp. NAM3COL9 TaxID=1667172 RepID=UPI00070B723E|nr:NAD(P)/FAD-dependent oxidoreductase [Staphylococcus sp. NAM3COL9]KRG10033.1 oxidoreductase [Staphylococcus sp. NAM3COL9]